ncbi:MAG: serine hydrolase domain-containing protein [Pseudomonadota bacterium]
MNTATLDALARSLTGPFAFCGIAVRQGADAHFAIGTGDGIAADPDTLFRVASISKMVTAAAFEVAATGAGLARPYDVPAAEVLGFDLTHPQWPATPITLGMLMTHTSGLWDEGGYLFDGPIPVQFDPDAMFSPEEPGTFFRYCNLGYILLAAAAEKLSGRRFDEIVAKDVLGPHDIAGGLNWVGVPPPAMRNTLPTYRHDGQTFAPQIDAPPVHPNLTSCQLGLDTWRFSPQGGLRLSLRGMLTLADVLISANDTPLWQTADGPGDYLDGLMQDYGAGLQFLPDPPFYPRPLTGHFANAYGFKGGVWRDGEADISFAYALNGLPLGDEDDALCNVEHQIFAVIAAMKDR